MCSSHGANKFQVLGGALMGGLGDDFFCSSNHRPHVDKISRCTEEGSSRVVGLDRTPNEHDIKELKDMIGAVSNIHSQLDMAYTLSSVTRDPVRPVVSLGAPQWKMSSSIDYLPCNVCRRCPFRGLISDE
jgi:hypothetical protein